MRKIKPTFTAENTKYDCGHNVKHYIEEEL